MNKLTRIIIGVATTLLIGSAHASLMISDNFIRLSAGESINAPFISSTGTSTVGVYEGLVEIIVSGTGYSYGLNENDAFYCSFASDARCPSLGAMLDSQYYQLNIGFNGLPFAGSEANNIDQFISYIENVGSVTSGTLPSYDAVSHTYHFVVTLPNALPSTLQFGVSDGIYSDNGGSYAIHVFQLAPVVVPEPATITLIALSLIGLIRRNRKAS